MLVSFFSSVMQQHIERAELVLKEPSMLFRTAGTSPSKQLQLINNKESRLQANFLSQTSATQSLVYCSSSLKDLSVNISCLSMNLNTCCLNFLLFERIWVKFTLIFHMYCIVPPFPPPTNGRT